MSNADDIVLFYAAANAVEQVAADPAGMHDDDITLVNSLRGFAHDLEAGRPVPDLESQKARARKFIETLGKKS
jgi:hypothetical protein